MTRDHGWRFLSLGRRIERLQFGCSVLLHAMSVEHGGLDWLLELFDSIVTYRARYMSRPEWLPVLDLVICDASNPRAVMFQARGLLDYLCKLSANYGPCGEGLLAQVVDDLDALDPEHDLVHGAPRLMEILLAVQNATFRLSDVLGSRFFTHIAVTTQAAA
jgi:uncharacterized alpha-E superfamily protein